MRAQALEGPWLLAKIVIFPINLTFRAFLPQKTPKRQKCVYCSSAARLVFACEMDGRFLKEGTLTGNGLGY